MVIPIPMQKWACWFLMLNMKWASVLAEEKAFPNLIILLADDLGYGEYGMQGNHQIRTPNIDSMAREGVRFTQAYVTAPNCSPSRAGLLTGRIPTRFGYEFNPIGARNEETRDWIAQAGGYPCGMVA